MAIIAALLLFCPCTNLLLTWKELFALLCPVAYLMDLFLPLNSSQKSLCKSSIEGLHPLLDFATVNAFWLCQYFVLISILMTAVEMSGSLIL